MNPAEIVLNVMKRHGETGESCGTLYLAIQLIHYHRKFQVLWDALRSPTLSGL
jgi:hypothetical protein